MARRMFKESGVHILVDGQFGSTGKGAFAAFLAKAAVDNKEDFLGVLSNAGPNSGHTFYHGDEKIVLKQLPTFAVMSHLLGETLPVYMTAGAIIDPEILFREARRWPEIPIYVHPNAVVITEDDVASEHSGTVAAVAGTRTGTGAALARKVLRDPTATFGGWLQGNSMFDVPDNVGLSNGIGRAYRQGRWFMEVSQGFSLGYHSRFYPKVTSRECTASQGLADAQLPPCAGAMVFMVVRTFPIRVGNHEGFSSGDFYPDQREITWEDLGVEPEKTTVTQRIRRVATFSDMQFREAVAANAPDVVLLNFVNYLKNEEERRDIVTRVRREIPPYSELFVGYGPKVEDIYLEDKYGGPYV